MAVIFSASGDTKSFNRSSRIIGPIVRFFFPSVPDDDVYRVVTFARKCAHLTEYAVLAVLFWRAVTKPKWLHPEPWNWKIAVWSIIFVALYAATDEIHQSMVPNRQGSALDVLIDTIGATLGILLLWRVRKFLSAIADKLERSPGRAAV